jgi:hypothetical protein
MARRGEVWGLRLLLSIIVLTIPAVLAAGCGGDEQDEVEATIRRAVETYNDGEVEAFLALHTDRAIESEYGLPRDLAAPRIAEFIGQPPIEVRDLSQATIRDDRATVNLERTQGKVVVLERVTLIKDRGGWKLDSFEDQPLDIPSTVTPVSIQMGEFSFVVDASGVQDGNIALTVRNGGQQDHETVVARIEEAAKLEDLVSAIAKSPEGDTPAGVDEIVAFGAYEPGESGNVIFAEPLHPGRYGIFCFFPDVNDPEHTPHALKGMFAEFRVPG